jgi:hypothetical protein
MGLEPVVSTPIATTSDAENPRVFAAAARAPATHAFIEER